jgi:hypothetical protein
MKTIDVAMLYRLQIARRAGRVQEGVDLRPGVGLGKSATHGPSIADKKANHKKAPHSGCMAVRFVFHVFSSIVSCRARAP